MDGKEERIKDTLEVSGVFPRWAGFGNLSHEADGAKSLNALFNLGDSKRENELGVANGFPNVSMSHEDMIIPETFAEFLGISESIKRGEVPGVNLTFDLLKLALQEESSLDVADYMLEDDSRALEEKRAGVEGRV